MKFTLKKVGKINQAEIELQGITVIAGEMIRVKVRSGKCFSACLMLFIRLISR